MISENSSRVGKGDGESKAARDNVAHAPHLSLCGTGVFLYKHPQALVEDR